MIAVLAGPASRPAAAQNYVFGTASYRDHVWLTSPQAPTPPAVTADFNHDGIPDVAVVSGTSSVTPILSAGIYLGRPDGTFAPIVNYSLPSQPSRASLVAGDFNGDGNIDLLVFDYPSSANALVFLAGNGDGTFQPAVTVSVNFGSMTPSGVVAADFNGDGKLDLAFSGEAGLQGYQVAIFPGNGDGTFQSPLTYSAAASPYLVTGDFNGDGAPDIAVAGETTDLQQSEISVLLDNGDGTFQSPVNYTISGVVQALAAADLNGDGKLDLITEAGGTSAPSVSVLPGNGDGTFGTPIVDTSNLLPLYSTTIAVADLNGDGKLDLAFSDPSQPENSVTVLLGNGDGTFQNPPSTYSAGVSPAVVMALDANGDGKPDLAFAAGGSDGAITVLINRGDGSFPNAVTYPVLPNPYSIAAGDFNGDGKKDLVITNYMGTGGVSALLGNGNGTFQPAMNSPTGTVPFGASPNDVVAGDFNRDGKLDLVVEDSELDSTPVLATLLGKGGGGFQDNINLALAGSVQSLAVDDFNGDGKLDVVATAGNTSNALIFLGKGDGTFASPQTVSVGPMKLSPPFHTVLTGDFNRDGKPDIAVATDKGVAVLLGNGDGTFQPDTVLPSLSSIYPGDELLAVGDFNGDGNLDIVKESETGQINVALGGGDGTFQESAAAFQLPSTLVPAAETTGDFNGDGNLDLALDSGGGVGSLMTVLLGNGRGTFGTEIDYKAGGDTSTPNSIVSADFNGDGASDVALASLGSSTVSVFVNSPVAAFAPRALLFANQEIGSTSAAQTMTVANPGSAPLRISGISVTGEYSETDNCSAPILPGKSCQVSVTFSPTSAGTLTGTLAFTDNASVVPQTLKLTGTGTGSHAEVSPASLTFGNQIMYTTSAAQAVMLTNTGTMALVISSITASSQFSQTNNCGASLASKASCAVNVAFAPTTEGTISGTLTLIDNSDNTPQKIPLQGTGKGPIVNLSATSLSFGNQFVGTTSAAQTVTLSNTGVLALTLTGITASGDFAETNNCGTSVAINATCTISVTFKPAAVGPRAGTVEIADDGAGSPQTITLTGTGVAPTFSASAANIIFAGQFVGTTSAPQTVTVTNTGTAVLAISTVTLGGANPAEFALSSDSCSGAGIAPAASCSVSVTYTPNAVAPAGALLYFKDNATASPQSVGLLGSGYANPVPLLNQPLVPERAAPGGPGFTLTVNGARFVKGATVDWNGAPLATTLVNGAQLTTSVPASEIAVAGTASVSVLNGGPGKAASNVVYFTVTTPVISPLFVNSNGSPPTNGLVTAPVAVGDFNGDGKLDVAISNGLNKGVAILLGNGDGTFKAAASLSAGGVGRILTGDFNGDGILDLATVGSTIAGGVSIFLGNGDGTFTAGPADAGAGQAFAVGDFNGDGKLDLASSYGSQLNILLGNGDGTFTGKLEQFLGSGVTGIVAGDFNGDGKLDLAAADALGGTVAILLGNGDGTFTPAASSPLTVNHPGSLVAGDFNGDGKLDLAASDFKDGTVTILAGNGDGTFTLKASSPATGFNPTSITVADMNGDGILDLVVTNSGSNNSTVLLGNGDGTFASAASTVQAAGMFAAGDFNGDGRLDLATVNGSILLQAGNGLSPASIDFGNEDVNLSSAAQPAALVNTQKTALTIANIAVSGEFSQTNNCPAQLAPGAGCAFSVTFSPTAGGTQTGTLTVTDDASGVAGTKQTISLSGTGVLAPLVSFSPTNLYFPSQPDGVTSAPQTVTVTDSGAANLVFESGSNAPGIYGTTHAADFAITSDTCAGQTIAPNGTCTVSVTFTPSTSASETAEISFVDNAGNSPQYFSLSGSGVAASASVSPGSLTFAALGIGTTSAAQSVTVTNSSSAQLIFAASPLSLIGLNSQDFAVQTDGCSGKTLAAGGTCAVSITFKPSVAGSESGQLLIMSNANNSPATVSLAGTGVTPDFTVGVTSGSPSTASVAPGETATYSISLGSLGGFTGTVTLLCSSAPQNSTCTVTPSSVTLDGTNPQNVSLNVATTAPSAAIPVAPEPPAVPPAALWMVLAGLMGLLAIGIRCWPARAIHESPLRRLRPITRHLSLVTAFALLLFVALAASCGGGGGAAPAPTPTGGTAPGTYTLSVTATSGNISHTSKVTLTVQ